MRRYAETTKVPEIQSRQQIELELMKKGADRVGIINEASQVAIAFLRDGISYRITLPMPIDEAEAVRLAYESAGPKQRRHYEGAEAITKERARRMRALLAIVKARLLAVDEQITEFEQEFLPFVVTDTGQTVGERYLPEIQAAKLAGRAPKALPGGEKE